MKLACDATEIRGLLEWHVAPIYKQRRTKRRNFQHQQVGSVSNRIKDESFALWQ